MSRVIQSTHTTEYRSDIDGLRALAVLPVVFYHANAASIPGGFVGVDIFFVISGYLISNIILREVKAGVFSFSRFYERRLRRIIPALLLVLLVTVVAFQVVALPGQAVGAAESGIAALLSVSNVYFWRETGYFAPTAEFLPLLHTWSLGVEEQFYFIFPIILLGFWKLRIPIKWVLASVTILAFLGGFWLSEFKPSVAYFLLPARAWELGLGAVIAAGIIPKTGCKFLVEASSSIGVVLIGLSVFFIHDQMVFPGWVALFPCFGAAMVIHSGGESWTARMVLSSRPIVAVGLLSYSLYLWHWPVFATFRSMGANVELEFSIQVAAIAITFGLAWLTWYFVERPFRNRELIPTTKAFKILGVGSMLLVAISVTSIASQGFPSRLNDAARVALAAQDDIDRFRSVCEGLHDLERCRFGESNLPVTYAIIGDSHAAALRPAIEASGIMGAQAGTLFWSRSCPFLDGAENLGASRTLRSSCASFKAGLWEVIEANEDLETIILGGRWPIQLSGTQPEIGGSRLAYLVDDQSVTRSIQENALVFRRSLGRTLNRLSERGINVIIIGSIPEPGADVPHLVAMRNQFGFAQSNGMRRDLVAARAGRADELIADLVSDRGNLHFVQVWTAFCDVDWCDIERDGVPVYHDDNHLSRSGAVSIVAPAIAFQSQ